VTLLVEIVLVSEKQVKYKSQGRIVNPLCWTKENDKYSAFRTTELVRVNNCCLIWYSNSNRPWFLLVSPLSIMPLSPGCSARKEGSCLCCVSSNLNSVNCIYRCDYFFRFTRVGIKPIQLHACTVWSNGRTSPGQRSQIMKVLKINKWEINKLVFWPVTTEWSTSLYILASSWVQTLSKS
jgi:hypothetical protein